MPSSSSVGHRAPATCVGEAVVGRSAHPPPPPHRLHPDPDPRPPGGTHPTPTLTGPSTPPPPPPPPLILLHPNQHPTATYRAWIYHSAASVGGRRHLDLNEGRDDAYRHVPVSVPAQIPIPIGVRLPHLPAFINALDRGELDSSSDSEEEREGEGERELEDSEMSDAAENDRDSDFRSASGSEDEDEREGSVEVKMEEEEEEMDERLLFSPYYPETRREEESSPSPLPMTRRLPAARQDAAETAPHLTVLSRVTSRLSDTAGVGTWTVADNTGTARGEERLSVEEGEKGGVEMSEKCG
ncbi:hypothetical protein NMY22_g3396 [Coprinellus aureogranulatus]|nr:hypothetical protein NMY22_g3396 [Coprinellus aureogranulatus]